MKPVKLSQTGTQVEMIEDMRICVGCKADIDSLKHFEHKLRKDVLEQRQAKAMSNPRLAFENLFKS